jgi:hypothetical protein
LFSSAASASHRAAPSVGRIPQSAFQNGHLNPSLVPDFVPALNRQGNVIGYVSKSDILPPATGPGGFALHASPASTGAIPVYDRSLTHVVGHMVPGIGFVPVGTPIPRGEIPADSPTVTTTTEVAGP